MITAREPDDDVPVTWPKSLIAAGLLKGKPYASGNVVDPLGSVIKPAENELPTT